jgi:hypothetical protein
MNTSKNKIAQNGKIVQKLFIYYHFRVLALAKDFIKNNPRKADRNETLLFYVLGFSRMLNLLDDLIARKHPS